MPYRAYPPSVFLNPWRAEASGTELDTGERLIELMRNQAGNLSDHRRSLHFHEAPVRFLCLVETLTLSFK